MSWTSAQIRSAFLDYFRGKDHEVVKSGPLLPPNDPSLLFANAGMVQFKDVFTGREQRPYKRATSSQKCIRISGKHNDLEAVGPSPRHHTFFEMLGNFSFGDYFKEQAIVLAWEFLTQTLRLPPERLIITYFGGEQGLAPDEAARDLWKKLTGLGEDRIRGLGMADNFWQMGETGPCGPCSEIHYYHGDGVELDRFGQEQTPSGHGWVEIWNLVFMQYNRSASAEGLRLDPLPAPSIDTGAGLERLCGAVQGKPSNYDVDLLRDLLDMAAEFAQKPYTGTLSPDDTSMRVIADHARTTAFLIAEGVLPDRTGREYVLRRVMRRAVRHAHRLGISEAVLSRIALAVVDRMKDAYPELSQRAELIASVCDQEETRFRATIERGLGLLEERFSVLASAQQTTLSGADAFQLYDTYGFPLDLTEVICQERGIQVDRDGYDQALEQARARAGEFKGAESALEGVIHAAQGQLGEDVRFVGYDRDQAESELKVLVVGAELVDQAQAGDKVDLVTAETPFYGESGGQLGDRGVIETETGTVRIDDTHKPTPGFILHRGEVVEGTISKGQRVRLSIDRAARQATRANHSATHLLHLALRRILGEHATQKGSVVGPERLRFDFTHDRPLTEEQKSQIERFVNQRIWDNTPIQTAVLDIEAARERGAMMIFEEKYGNVVRMVSMAESRELCGGTHARATGDLGLFKITSEQGIAAGVRRIAAVTGPGALAHLSHLEDQLDRAAQTLKVSLEEVPDKVLRLQERCRKLEKQLEETERKRASESSGGPSTLLQQARDVVGIRVLACRTELTDRARLRELAEQLRDRLGPSIVLVGSVAEGKVQLVLTVAAPLIPRFSAGVLVKSIAAKVGGTGGGRPDMAQAGGTQPEHLDEALESLYVQVQASEQ